MKQNKIDEAKFIELFSSFTGIKPTNIKRYLKDNLIKDIFDHPASLTTNINQIQKINDLKELKGLYNLLKDEKDNIYELNSPEKAYNYFKNFYVNKYDKERMVCSFLDSKFFVIKTEIMFEGTVGQSHVFPREIVKTALLYDSAHVVISHNHPSGDIKPSKEDISITSLIKEALGTLNIPLADHIIVGRDKYFSFTEENIPLDKESVFGNFREEFNNGISNLSENTLLKVEELNNQNGNPMSIKDIKEMYASSIKDLEVSYSQENINRYSNLKSIINDLAKRDKSFDLTR